MPYSSYFESELDQHVFSIHPLQKSRFASALNDINDCEKLAKFILTNNFESGIIQDPLDDINCPGKVIEGYVGLENILEMQRRHNISAYEALGAAILSGLVVNSAALRLSPSPPQNIHAMQRGKYWVGDIYLADLIAKCLAESNLTINGRMLDYGCSSGSLVRVLASAYPDVQFCGTDPVRSSIDWANANLKFPNAKFFHQGQIPPLPFDANSFDFVSAISIWSHHGIRASKIWFDEMYRIIKPGGICIFTTHGLGSILFYTQQAQKPLDRFKEMYAAYLASGFVFEEVWIGEDDSGNTATELDWGNSYFDRKIIAALTCGMFEVLAVNSRANQQNQDVYTMRKVAAPH